MSLLSEVSVCSVYEESKDKHVCLKQACLSKNKSYMSSLYIRKFVFINFNLGTTKHTCEFVNLHLNQFQSIKY